MSEAMITTDWFSRPGDTVRTLLQQKQLSASLVASRLEGGINALRGLYDGSVAIDQHCAKVLAEVLGGSPTFWLNRQSNYERALESALDRAVSEESDAWLSKVPAPDGKKPRAHSNEARIRQEVRRRLVYFNTARLSSWERCYGEIFGQTHFRSSAAFSSSEESTILWLRKGEIEADLVVTREWSPQNLRSIIPEIRRLTRVSHPGRFLGRLKLLLADSGVALAVVKAPSGCRASGAVRLVAPGKAMILVSFRHRTDDQFWFTLFHEIGHLILHSRQTFVDDETTPEEDLLEAQANQFAADCILPGDLAADLVQLRPSRDAILRFGLRAGVSPGLIVGQLQHRRLLPYERFNSLKRTWSWAEIESANASP